MKVTYLTHKEKVNYFGRLFYSEDYSTKDILKKLELGFFYDSYSKQNWEFYPKNPELNGLYM